jgi:hypothetical protein
LKSDGTVVAWGCGNPNFDAGQCNVPSDLSGVSAIAASDHHSLALKSDGTVVAWGCAGFGSPLNYGQCAVPAGLSGVTAIAAGYYDSLALKSDGTVVAWACAFAGDHGECNVPGDLSNVSAISAGVAHSLALKSDGTVVSWGCSGGDVFGQCGVPAGLSNAVAIAAGQWHSLALKSDGTVVAWGCGTAFGFSSDFGQCSVPVGLTGVTAIAAGWYHSMALAELQSQTITFASLASKTYGASDFTVSAAASSGLPVSFTASGHCTVNGATVHLTGAGSCAITASQAGSVNYLPATHSQAFAIAKASQTISFGLLKNKTYGAPDFNVGATASSGLPVSFGASGKCTVNGAIAHLTGVGSCAITASQPGNANYRAAANVTRSFSIARVTCRVPKVVGRSLASAKRVIARRHCRTGKVGRARSSKLKQGIVISQSRQPGRVLPGNSKINLVVSRGSGH